MVKRKHTKTSPLISVIICTKDRSKKLSTCLDSFKKSSFKDFELVVVDQSLDSETEKLSKKYKKLNYFRIKAKGLSYARNFGIKKAKAEILAFTDDDCLVSKDWLKAIYKSFLAHPEVVGLLGRTLPYEPTKHKNLVCPCTFKQKKIRECLITKPAEHWKNIGYGNNMAFRKKIFNKLGGFKSWLGVGTIGHSAEDAEFSLRILLDHYKLFYQSKMLVFHNSWFSKEDMRGKNLAYIYGELACYGYFALKNHSFAKKVIKDNIRLSLVRTPKKIIKSLLFYRTNFFNEVYNWVIILLSQIRGFLVAILGFCIEIYKNIYKKFNLLKKNKKIIIYCSVVPYNVPPHSWFNAAKVLSQFTPVIFIDQLNPRKFAYQFSLFGFIKWLFLDFLEFNNFVIWNFDFFLSKYLLYLYLNFLKNIFHYQIFLITNTTENGRIYKFIPHNFSILECTDKYFYDEFEVYADNIKKFDRVLTNTKIITDEVSKINPETYRISSGYSEDLSFTVSGKSAPKIKNSIVFSGGISRRIDYRLLRKVVKQMPDYNFFFMGEVYLDKFYQDGTVDSKYLEKWNSLLKLKNFHYLGAFKRKESVNLLQLFTCGLIPYYSLNTMNYYSHPVKFYEYLFANLNVVSTDIPSIREYVDLKNVYIIKNVKEMVTAIKKNTKKNSEKDQKILNKSIKKIIEEQSTKLKAEQIISHIENLICV